MKAKSRFRKVIIKPGVVGNPVLSGFVDQEEIEQYLVFTTGIATKSYIRKLCKAYNYSYSQVKSCTFVEAWLGGEFIGFAAFSILNPNEVDYPDYEGESMVVELKLVLLEEDLRGCGIGVSLAEHCASIFATIACQHVMLNKVDSCSFTLGSDFVTKEGEKFFHDLFEYSEPLFKDAFTIMKKTYELDWDGGF